MGSVKLTKNDKLDKFKYRGYGTEFDSRSEFLFTDASYGADMSSSVHIGNKNRDILILGEGPTQEFDDTTLTAKAKHRINFTQSGKTLV